MHFVKARTKSWLLDWLHSPVPALGGQCPADYLHTPAGIDLVSRLLASAQSGAYWEVDQTA
ncbi:MbcA/ParS/Xre antitoxin family protein [Burkholderia ambifaria]|uniref:MbcA/ParS/Xre antitoxin family protein n=1 Tax=Burkholderia ambifaria TaxID=152480 RepID=UPI001FC81D94|nr:MbcA/ParS/Xre antitoxin family protein [Burkholderia ambifaria]